MTKRELVKILTKNKWRFSADGSSLLPSALRPHLLMFWSKENGSKNRRSILTPSADKSKIHRSIISSNLVKFKNHKTIISALTTISIILSSIIIFGSSKPVSAASLTLSIPESISLSISTQNSVTYKASSKSNITIKTDAYSGYTLNIKSKDGTNTLKSSEGKTISSISSALDNYQSNGATNTWAFLPDKLNSTSNTKFQPGPKSDVLLGQSSSSNSTPDTYPISIAAKIDNTQPTGTYKNTFTITATTNPVPYTFSYNANGGSSAPSTQSGTGSEGSTKNLTTSTPSKSGYTFQGWCTVNPGTSESCSGTKYSSGGSYTLTNSSNSVTFYAIWKATGNTMQNWSGCNSLSTNQTVTLTDSRDNNQYTVAKLLDGKCWMTQNLRIGSNNSTTLLRSSDSDNSSDYTLPQGGDFDASYTPRIHIEADSNRGGYYTWYAAVAGDMSTSSGDAPYSICAKGWRLPNRSEQEKLISYYTYSTILQQPAYFVLNGYWQYKQIYYPDPSGISTSQYWSSTASGSSAYRISLTNSQLWVNSGYAWSNTNHSGYYVRCISRN